MMMTSPITKKPPTKAPKPVADRTHNNVTLNKENETLVIGIPRSSNRLTKEVGFVYTNDKGKTSIFQNGEVNPQAKYVISAAANENTFDATSKEVATTIEIGSSNIWETQSRTSVVKADGNERITTDKNTSIGNVSEDKNGMVTVEFVNKREGSDVKNIVKVVAKKDDMLKILDNSKELDKDLIAKVKDKIDALKDSTTSQSTSTETENGMSETPMDAKAKNGNVNPPQTKPVESTVVPTEEIDLSYEEGKLDRLAWLAAENPEGQGKRELNQYIAELRNKSLNVNLVNGHYQVKAK